MLWNGNECEKKTKVMRISRQSFPVKLMTHQKTTAECGIFYIFR
jgi:hypothetical protein